MNLDVAELVILKDLIHYNSGDFRFIRLYKVRGAIISSLREMIFIDLKDLNMVVRGHIQDAVFVGNIFIYNKLGPNGPYTGHVYAAGRNA